MSARSISRLMLCAMLTTGFALTADVAVASASSPARHAVSVPAKKKKPTVKLATTSLGKILVSADGHTLYAFDPDAGDINTSKCTGGCATVWLGLKATGKPVAGKGLKKSQLVVGESGQVAYGGHLLYNFSGDTAPGATGGQGIAGVWHVVGADGNTIT
jgi:predicted lipoprotein with Yx(FWY)xxD motif